MSENSKIEWTDHTFNPWEGCTKVSAGCKNCYAETRNARFGGGTAPNWGPGAPRRRTSEENWKLPLKWNRAASKARYFCLMQGQETPPRPRVFCASLADWLDPEVPIEWLRELLDLIRETPNLDWQLLTKRPELWQERIGRVVGLSCVTGCDVEDPHGWAGWLANRWQHGHAPANVWLGTSVEDQAAAKLRIPQLLKIPAKTRFLSCEPLLGPVYLPLEWEEFEDGGAGYIVGIHWVIAGGESGPGARPMDPDWARSLRNQCAAANVPFLFKQWGEWSPGIVADLPTGVPTELMGPDSQVVARLGKKAAGRLLDGIEHNGFPTEGAQP